MASGTEAYDLDRDAGARAIVLRLAKWHAGHPDDTEGRTLAQLFPAGRRDAGTNTPPLSELTDAARRLAASGLVELAEGQGGRMRLRLTANGRAVAARMEAQGETPAANRRRGPQGRRDGRRAAARGQAPVEPQTVAQPAHAPETALLERIGVLEARLASVLERLERLEAWQRSHAGPGDARPGGAGVKAVAPLLLDTFRARLFSALDRLDRENRQLGLVPVPRVRQALADLVSGADFDRMVLELAARREVLLVPHDRPAALPPEERAACIRDPALGQLYYWFRWRM